MDGQPVATVAELRASITDRLHITVGQFKEGAFYHFHRDRPPYSEL